MDLIRHETKEIFHIPKDCQKKVIGRNTQADIVLASPHVSRLQCEVGWALEKDEFLIKNRSKTSLLYVDQQDLGEGGTAIIKDGSWIGVGVPLAYRLEKNSNLNYVFLQAKKTKIKSPTVTNIKQEKPDNYVAINKSNKDERKKSKTDTNLNITMSPIHTNISASPEIERDIINVEDDSHQFIMFEGLGVEIVSNASYTNCDKNIPGRYELLEHLKDARPNFQSTSIHNPPSKPSVFPPEDKTPQASKSLKNVSASGSSIKTESESQDDDDCLIVDYKKSCKRKRKSSSTESLNSNIQIDPGKNLDEILESLVQLVPASSKGKLKEGLMEVLKNVNSDSPSENDKVNIKKELTEKNSMEVDNDKNKPVNLHHNVKVKADSTECMAKNSKTVFKKELANSAPNNTVKSEIKNETDSDDDCFQYSQIHDCILVSSDDEEHSSRSQLSESFGPAPVDIDDDIIILNDLTTPGSVSLKSIKTEMDVPPPDGQCDVSSPENLSKDDLNHSSDDELPDLQKLVHKKVDNSTKDLDSVVSKLKIKHSVVSSAKPIEPIKPPARCKNDALKKCKVMLQKLPLTSAGGVVKAKDSIRLKKKSNLKMAISQACDVKPKDRIRSKKKSDLVMAMSKAYDVKVMNHNKKLAKKKHHLVECTNKPSTSKMCPIPDNISIQSRKAKDKDKLTGIAKITGKTRSDKLIREVDIFEKLKPPKSLFKIPKEKPSLHKPVLHSSVLLPRKKPEPLSPRDSKTSSKPSTSKQKSVHWPEENQLTSVQKIPSRIKTPVVPPSTMDPLEFVQTVCDWNYDWLCTYKTAKEKSNGRRIVKLPPELLRYSLPTLITYENFQDYASIFTGLMYQEVWESIYRDWVKYHGRQPVTCNCKVEFQRESFIKSNKKRLYNILCTMLLDDIMVKDKTYPREGSLIAIKYKVQENRSTYAFAYVGRCHKDDAVRDDVKDISIPNPKGTLYLSVFMTKKCFPTGIKTMSARLMNVSYIRTSMRTFESLCNLTHCVLLKHILKPHDMSVFSETIDKGMTFDSISRIKLDRSQLKAVVDVAKKCVFNPETPKISLIHGPPGTGKSTTISALVAQIVKYMKTHKNIYRNRRILLCAPSNAAIDELTLKLVDLNKSGIVLNVVRVGVQDSINQKVLPNAYHIRYRQEYERLVIAAKNQSIETEYRTKLEAIEAATLSCRQAPNDNPQEIFEREKKMRACIKDAEDFFKRCEKNLSLHRRDQLYTHAQKKVLQEAEVITSTIGSCAQKIISQPFDPKRPNFGVCIIDEAGQCKETETWLAMVLRINKLVLVGDHQQLPATVLSQHAQEQNLHQSLFERLYHYLSKQDRPDDYIQSLTIQYRMHSSIMMWPARHFYDNKLSAGPQVDELRSCSMKPYIVFDVQDGQETKWMNDICNKMEINMVVKLVRFIHDANQKSIGVITPYQEQRKLIYNRLKRPSYLTVSTVDTFQGQERDVIICSFVRANGGSSIGFVSDRNRLNVALTRAKSCCIIIGHLSSLVSSSSDFKSLVADAKHRGVIIPVNNAQMLDDHQLMKMIMK